MNSVADWLAWGALLLPLCAMAWSARSYLQIQRKIAEQKEFDNFFETLERVHNGQKSAILQRAAIFELRNYPQYSEFVLRLCDQAEHNFPTSPNPQGQREKLLEEFQLTAEQLKKKL